MGIANYKAIFWDFDGVIKDSVAIKTNAYLDLFSTSPDEIKNKIQEHHAKNGGISRFKKIPLYMEWAGIPISTHAIESFILKFSEIVEDAVVASPWIPGVEKVLYCKNKHQLYFIVTGTPQIEIESILIRLKINKYFDRVYGAPIEKKDAIREALNDFSLSTKECLMIGDSETDYLAAKESGVNFWLRSNGEDEFSKEWNGTMLMNFEGIL